MMLSSLLELRAAQMTRGASSKFAGFSGYAGDSTTTVPSPSFSRTGILHVHSCETVLRISGVTLGVLLCEPEPGLVLAMRATRNPISLLLGLKPHTQKTKNEKKRSGSPAPAS